MREAELAAVGVGQHDVSLFRELADVEVVGAELKRRGDRVLLSGGAGAGQVGAPGSDRPFQLCSGRTAGRPGCRTRAAAHRRGRRRPPVPEHRQKPARRPGSCASKVRASSREGISRMLDAGEALPHAPFSSTAASTSTTATGWRTGAAGGGPEHQLNGHGVPGSERVAATTPPRVVGAPKRTSSDSRKDLRILLQVALTWREPGVDRAAGR